EGEIFAIQKDLFSDDQLDLDADNFSIPKSLKNEKKFAVQLPQNKYVNSQLAYLWMKKPEIMDTWLQRKERYFPMMEKIFEEEKVPKELMHLAMIESGLNPMARSKAAAVGMWQFIKATGAAYGLEVNYWVDDRRDPVKSTRAAARHLSDLYKIWGDWHLALANYNVSPRRMKYAVRNSGGVKDYWVIYPYLPRETRGYVPIFIATVMIATNPEEFGFKAKYGTQEPYQYETVDVIGSYDLKLLAQTAGISEEELREFNPALLRWATPPGKFAYPLRLPIGAKETFLANFKDLPVSAKKEHIFVHNVKKGETLGRIARKYGVTVRDLYESNDRLGKVIRIGQEIMVPIPAGKSGNVSDDLPVQRNRTYVSSTKSYRNRPANSTKIVYIVRKGDTVGEIAEWFKTRASNIRSWNGTSNTIRVGQKLSVYVPNNRASLYVDINSMSNKEKNELGRSKSTSNVNLATVDSDGYVTYTVQSNDNLYDIANNFGISISELKRLNKLRKNTIFPGQVLKIKEK
ncbi:MAG: LysM peptidoglycan-binding domain-containing protein, partial [Bacteroidetes bacterium]|nr:LysM peptidoglycan-binding domain-containing protein [Bacteroidota bacterium]